MLNFLCFFRLIVFNRDLFLRFDIDTFIIPIKFYKFEKFWTIKHN